MTLPQVYELFDYWRESPPEHEIAAIFARAYTTWKPIGSGPQLTPEQQHLKSLEERWAAGAMNVKQMYEGFGGTITTDNRGGGPKLMGADIPGIGPFPGAIH